MRFYIGVNQYTPIAALHGDMGWVTQHQRQTVAVARHWIRTNKKVEGCLASQCCEWVQQQDRGSKNSKSWCSRVKSMFNSVGQHGMCDNMYVRVTSKASMLGELKQLMWTKNVADWTNEVNRVEGRRGKGRNKLRLYKTFKSEYKTEPYIQDIMSYKHRKALARLRCGVAPLAIETGRYTNTAEEMRVCFNCNDCVENELHAIFQCPLYDDIRYNLLQKALDTHPGFDILNNTQQLNILMANAGLQRDLAKICYEIFERRKSFLHMD